MDAIDNPSYFNVPSEAPKKSRHNFLRKWAENKNSATLPANSTAKKSTIGTGSRRNFKSLMRANSEDTQLLVLGKPRPCDLAPSLYLNRQQRHLSTGNVIGSNDLLHQDMVHCGGVADDDGDVFLSNNANVQYYNTSTLPVKRILTSGRRRHSIGSFLNRDRSFATNIDTDARSRESSIRRKFKPINVDKAVKMEDELDILLVSCGDSEAATLWVNYLISCFQQISRERNKPPFKLHCIKVEDILIPIIGNGYPCKCPEARLQIVVICPTFLQKIQAIPENETSLGKIFHPDKVVAMMLGVQEHSENNHIRTVIPNYEHWRKMVVKDQDSNFVGDFLGVAMDILTKSWQIQEALNSELQRTYFSILPKKVKVGQNKLIVLLTEPLLNEDLVKVSIEKGGGQQVEVTTVKRRNPYTLQFTVPVSCLQLSTLVNVIVEKNGKPLGKRTVKCENRMRELDQILRTLDNPINFMCQSFGLNSTDRDQLDTFLLNVFLKNLPPNVNLLKPVIPINKSSVCNEEYPTLLHFTAKYGLEKLSWQLLESPGGEQACQIRNSSHLTPAEIAERANHSKLAIVLRNYMQMAEFSCEYNYLKGIEKQKSAFEENYKLPRPLNDTYIIPPAARPVNPSAVLMPITDSSGPSSPYYANFKPCIFSLPLSSPSFKSSNLSFPPAGMENYDIPRNGRPCTPCSPRTPPTPSSPLEKNVERKFEGYLDMHPTGNESSHFGSISSFNTNADFSEHHGSFSKLDGCDSVSSPTDSHAPSSKYGSANHLSSRERLNPDDELLEIINDFKNNVFTIAEVEALVESWQNRNDVQQSFRDKQEQLNKMREEYDKIQKTFKEQMKRPTPFERIRKFFSRGKSKHSESSERSSIGSDVSIPQARPASNISLQSSSSSSSVGASCISSGSGGTLDVASTHKSLHKSSASQEKLNAKSNNHDYTEIPHPPKHLDLSSHPDFSEYVQPDNAACTTNNRLSSCSSSVVNNTIPECVEVEILETCSNANQKIDNRKRLETYHFNMMKNDKVTEEHRTNSLRLQSKNKSKNSKQKVKSAENLMYEREYTNINYNENYVQEQPRNVAFNSPGKEEELSKEPTDGEFSACQKLCAETIKCLSSITNKPQDDDVTSEITFKFDKIAEAADSSTQSECGSLESRQNSSLDLSSLSLNSNCTVDENGDIKCSLELKITEEGEIETENAPPVSTDIPCVNMHTLPEYVNVNIQNTSSLPRHKCTVVSS